VFGLALCSQFDTGCRAAPILVERCTRTLEELAFADTTLDLYKVYHSSPNEQTPELRQKLNEGKTGAPWPASRSDRAITRAINSRQSCHDVRLTGCKNVEARHQMHAALWRTPSILREGARKARLYFARQIEISGTTNERTSFVLWETKIRLHLAISPNIYAYIASKFLSIFYFLRRCTAYKLVVFGIILRKLPHFMRKTETVTVCIISCIILCRFNCCNVSIVCLISENCVQRTESLSAKYIFTYDYHFNSLNIFLSQFFQKDQTVKFNRRKKIGMHK